MTAIGPPGGQDAGELAELELRRLSDRLASLSAARLEGRGESGDGPASRVRAVLTALADLGADAEGLPRRPVPVLAPHALADQLQVLARDALRAGGPALRQDVHARLVALRRSL